MARILGRVGDKWEIRAWCGIDLTTGKRKQISRVITARSRREAEGAPPNILPITSVSSGV